MLKDKNLNNTWEDFFLIESKKEYFKVLDAEIEHLYKVESIEPKFENLYKAFNLTELCDVKVVIIGQDPYYNKGVATGLCFATNNNVITRSLGNIFKNITKQKQLPPIDTSLEYLSRQGVFLLNRTLAVILKIPNSLKNIGFQTLTLNAIKYLNKVSTNIVYILWGKEAAKLENIISKDNLIIKSTHPSPLSANKETKDLKAFFKVDFSKKANDYLLKTSQIPIKWI